MSVVADVSGLTKVIVRYRKLADIAPLLEVEDMVRMKNPDWKCVFTYVQSFYRRFAMQPKSEQQHKQHEEKAEEKHEEATDESSSDAVAKTE